MVGGWTLFTKEPCIFRCDCKSHYAKIAVDTIVRKGGTITA